LPEAATVLRSTPGQVRTAPGRCVRPRPSERRPLTAPRNQQAARDPHRRPPDRLPQSAPAPSAAASGSWLGVGSWLAGGSWLGGRSLKSSFKKDRSSMPSKAEVSSSVSAGGSSPLAWCLTVDA
jgi:hypothetical protein